MYKRQVIGDAKPRRVSVVKVRRTGGDLKVLDAEGVGGGRLDRGEEAENKSGH